MAVNFKRILADALIELDNEKPLEKITVMDIVEKSGTARQTFYNHFKDKNDLIYWIYQRTLSGERNIVKEKGYYYYYVQVMEKNQRIHKFLRDAIRMTGQNTLTDMLYQQNFNYYRHYIESRYGKEAITEEVTHALYFNARGATYAFIRWINEGAPGSAEEQAKWTLQCMPDVIKKYMSFFEGTDALKRQ